MKGKIISMLGRARKRAGVVLLSGVLIATIGAGTVLAANSGNSLLVKMQNGTRSYSTDGGNTWTEKAPEGVTVSDKDGKLTITNGIAPEDADGKSILCKVENGVRNRSTDGGKTWSEEAPEGIIESTSEDGKLTLAEEAEGKGILCRTENGVTTYSTDGGATWNEIAPEYLIEAENEDGTFSGMVDNLPESGSIMIQKDINGTVRYSIDGGETWSDKAPEGFTTSPVENDSLPLRLE